MANKIWLESDSLQEGIYYLHLQKPSWNDILEEWESPGFFEVSVSALNAMGIVVPEMGTCVPINVTTRVLKPLRKPKVKDAETTD